jgi:hypothetical protein
LLRRNRRYKYICTFSHQRWAPHSSDYLSRPGFLSPEIKAILGKHQIALEKKKVLVQLYIQLLEVGTTNFCSDYLSSSSFTRDQKILDKHQFALEKQKVQVHLFIQPSEVGTRSSVLIISARLLSP